MAKISLKKKLENLALIVLSFVGITYQKDSNGKMIAILQLEEPIPQVRGTQEFEMDGVRRPIIATEVTEVKVHEDDFNEDFLWDEETDTGHYKGSDLILDVSQAGQVWMKSKSFAAGSREFRGNARSERLRKALGVKAPAKTENNKDLTPVDVNKG